MALQLPANQPYAAHPHGLVVQPIQVTLSMSAPRIVLKLTVEIGFPIVASYFQNSGGRRHEF